MERLGLLLRAIRERRKLTLGEVAERCKSLAIEAGDNSYRLSAGWLSRLERHEHQITSHNLVALAHVYGIETGHLIRAAHSNVVEELETSSLTSLIPSAQRIPVTPYRWGIIGNDDQTLAPLIPAGSLVMIDTRKRLPVAAKRWANEFHRPIFFISHKQRCFCGWCEVDPVSRSLMLIPHPLSPASVRQWRAADHVEIVGRVVAVSAWFGPEWD